MSDYEHHLFLCMKQGQLLAELHGHLSCLLEHDGIADWARPITAELTARAKEAYRAPLFPSNEELAA